VYGVQDRICGRIRSTGLWAGSSNTLQVPFIIYCIYVPDVIADFEDHFLASACKSPCDRFFICVIHDSVCHVVEGDGR
jgi:hypothetical protein